MGTALITIKIMPESPQADLEAIQEKAKQVVEEKQGKTPSTKTEPVAFGLNAVILNFSMDESLSQDSFESALKEIEQVNSVEVIDFRRAFG
jgi:elongation factor 1-beta|tara:strand:- start:1123 stop:1395 length:273 start_codon:yes stop_codon:yes gene_type:complete